ncbi:MAG: MarR family winged helix-turn-helix transcriptional regulator [Pseudonocardiaceae bacterium]
MTAGTELGLAHLLSQVESRVTRRLVTVLRAHDCELAEWRVLRLLADARGRPMNEIKDFVLLPGPTLTKLIDRMVADNLVYRRGDLEDRRRVLVFPAPRGVAKYEAIRATVDSDQLELAERIGDEQLAELTRMLSQVADALR